MGWIDGSVDIGKENLPLKLSKMEATGVGKWWGLNVTSGYCVTTIDTNMPETKERIGPKLGPPYYKLYLRR